jgi:methyl-accepting chemotaxis protein
VVAEGDFQRRVEVPGRDEIGQVEGAFNAMAAWLDEAVARERSPKIRHAQLNVERNAGSLTQRM